MWASKKLRWTRHHTHSCIEIIADKDPQHFCQCNARWHQKQHHYYSLWFNSWWWAWDSLRAEEAHWCGRQSALMHRLDGRWARGSNRSQCVLAEVSQQWQLAAVRTFILTQRKPALSNYVWEVWQKGVAALWLNGNYVWTCASGCGWTIESDRSGGSWCNSWGSFLFMSLVCI